MTWTLFQILKIDRTYYHVIRLKPDPAVATAAIELQKPDGKKYHLHRTKHGVECSCPSYNWRHRNRPTGCKHVVAATEAGLI